MSFENLKFGRIAVAIGIAFGVGFALTALLYACYFAPDYLGIYTEFDPDGDPEVERDKMQERMNEILDKQIEDIESNAATLNVLAVVGWLGTAVVTFFMAFRTARLNATTPQQATGYGIMIGGGTMLSYGFCTLCNVSMLPITLIGLGLLLGGGYFGGQLAGQNLALGTAGEPAKPRGPLTSGLGTLRAAPAASPTGPRPDVYYNMGVQAALGGRPDEAREHFKRVLQMNPRHINAWLQLANLAPTPEDAWNHIQQARAIDANDPAVVDAVNVIWPQVAARAQQAPPASPAAPENADSQALDPDAPAP